MQYYFAPLESITTYVYRGAHAAVYGPLDKYFIPFLQPVEKRELKARELLEILPENNRGFYAVPQILTIQSDGFVRLAKALGQRGYEEINLNIGCPSRTVVSKNKGAGLLAFPGDVDRLLEGIFEGLAGTGLRVSVKTRAGRTSGELLPELLEVYNRYPLEELIVHPRLQTDYYKNSPRPELFRYAAKHSRNPLCYNGDIFDRSCLKEVQEKFPKTDCFMLGRGLLMRPGMLSPEKNQEEQRKDFIGFQERICEGYLSRDIGNVNLLHKLKELWVYQIHMFGNPEKYAKRLRKCQRLDEFHELVRELVENCEIIN